MSTGPEEGNGALPHHHPAPLDQLLADGGEMHLVRAVADADEAGVDIGAGQEGVLRDAGGAMDLDGAVDDAGGHAGHHDLGRRDQVARRHINSSARCAQPISRMQ